MKPLKKIVIVGGGSAGWIAAAILGHHLKGKFCEVELVESDDIGTIGVGESTIPPFMTLLRNLGINEQEFIQATQASFKLGIRFKYWHRKEESYFHPFGAIGGNIEAHDFYHCWLKAKQQGHSAGLQEFAPCSAMADQGKFFLPHKAQKTPIAKASYALHLDAKLAAEYLRRYAEALGVIRTEGMVTDVCQKECGDIEKIILKSGKAVGGDFFIDCTGFRALLIEKTLDVGYEDWTNFLPCDRAIAVQTESHGATVPYTIATARDAGWTWRIPLQHRTGNGYVYSSKFCSDEEARETLLKNIDGPMINDPRVIPFTTGIRKQVWHRNCLSLGLASGFIEPLESTAIHLVVRGMDFFVRFFPDMEHDPILIDEYNRRMSQDYEEIRDFIVLHYCTTERDDTPFWSWCKNMDIPASLRERIELFKARAVLRDGVDELFKEDSWYSVFEGMGVRPKKYNPMVDRVNYQMIDGTLNGAPGILNEMVKTLPSHDEFLREFCPAPKLG
jgi:tryptophan halogenase